MHVWCDLHGYQGDLPDAGEGMCCEGAAVFGPERCTCWDEVHDLKQSDPRVDMLHTGRAEPCQDCAYSAGSPERRGEGHVVGDQDMLDELVRLGQPFWCHQGIRRVVALRHGPTGIEHRAPSEFAVAYRPPIIKAGPYGERPYKADGTPA